jgi:hypothetical protein
LSWCQSALKLTEVQQSWGCVCQISLSLLREHQDSLAARPCVICTAGVGRLDALTGQWLRQPSACPPAALGKARTSQSLCRQPEMVIYRSSTADPQAQAAERGAHAKEMAELRAERDAAVRWAEAAAGEAAAAKATADSNFRHETANMCFSRNTLSRAGTVNAGQVSRALAMQNLIL